jgi:hypothetical protein
VERSETKSKDLTKDPKVSALISRAGISQEIPPLRCASVGMTRVVCFFNSLLTHSLALALQPRPGACPERSRMGDVGHRFLFWEGCLPLRTRPHPTAHSAVATARSRRRVSQVICCPKLSARASPGGWVRFDGPVRQQPVVPGDSFFVCFVPFVVPFQVLAGKNFNTCHPDPVRLAAPAQGRLRTAKWRIEDGPPDFSSE